MAIDTKPLDQLDENDLLVLIAEGLSERRVRDYKAALPGNSEGERKEFLYDVSSFANAAGGHLIYGMVEEGGIPIQLPGIAIANAEAEVLRLAQMARTGIDPDPRLGLDTRSARERQHRNRSRTLRLDSGG